MKGTVYNAKTKKTIIVENDEFLTSEPYPEELRIDPYKLVQKLIEKGIIQSKQELAPDVIIHTPKIRKTQQR